MSLNVFLTVPSQSSTPTSTHDRLRRRRASTPSVLHSRSPSPTSSSAFQSTLTLTPSQKHSSTSSSSLSPLRPKSSFKTSTRRLSLAPTSPNTNSSLSVSPSSSTTSSPSRSPVSFRRSSISSTLTPTLTFNSTRICPTNNTQMELNKKHTHRSPSPLPCRFIESAQEEEYDHLLFQMLSLPTNDPQQKDITNWLRDISGASCCCMCCGSTHTKLLRFGKENIWCKRCVNSQHELLSKVQFSKQFYR